MPKKVNILNGNWLAKSQISFTTATQFIYEWVHEITNINWYKYRLNLKENTVKV